MGGPVSLHDRRATFDTVVDSPSPRPGVAGLRFLATFSGGRKTTVNLTDHALPGIAAAAATILWEETQPGGALRSPGSVVQITESLSRLGDFLAEYERGSAIASVADLLPEDIDRFEDYLRRRYGAETRMPWIRLQALRQFLEMALRHGYTGDHIRPRLAFVSRGGKGKQKPRDAYSPFIASQMREGAKKDIEATIERMTVTGAAFIARGLDPAEHGWRSPHNIGWHLAHRGLVTTRDHNIPNVFIKLSYQFTDVVSYVHLGSDDVLAFMVALSLGTGLPIECVRSLQADCLRNEKGGYADLLYVKRRRGVDTEARKRVKVDTRFSPGWLIRIVLRLTHWTRTQADAETATHLFIGYVPRFGLTSIVVKNTGPAKNDPVSRFTARHGVVDDNGQPMDGFVLARLRKTFKGEQYIKAHGHLADVADDHSKGVMALHYANIPSLVPLHEATIADGLQAALDAAFVPIVLDADGEDRLRTDQRGLADEWGRPEEQVAAVADGRADVWMAGCLDFHHSPHGNPDRPCPSPVWGCLECSNAVITASKLPAILAFLNHILGKRQQMNMAAWTGRFGRAHYRITQQILPRFPEREIVMAKAVAEAEEHLLWLPAELTLAP